MNAPIDISRVVLQTDRLLLRCWRETDLHDFYAYARVDGVGQPADWPPHKSLADTKAIPDTFIKEKTTFALEHRGHVIGSLGIEEYHRENFPELEPLAGRALGYALSKDYWGQGLMPEAVRAVTDYLFRVQKLDFLLLGHFVWNHQSARVAEKCGFRYSKTCTHVNQYGKTEATRQNILCRPGLERVSW